MSVRPQVGDVCTVSCGTDRDPAIVTSVSSGGKRCKIRKLHYKAKDEAYMGHQDWLVDVSRPYGDEISCYLDKDCHWRTLIYHELVRMGEAAPYYCWEF